MQILTLGAATCLKHVLASLPTAAATGRCLAGLELDELRLHDACALYYSTVGVFEPINTVEIRLGLHSSDGAEGEKGRRMSFLL